MKTGNRNGILWPILLWLALMLIPRLTLAGQPEPDHLVPCSEGNEPVALQYGDRTEGCAIEDPYDLDHFSFCASSEDVGKSLGVLARGSSTICMEIWHPDGFRIFQYCSPNVEASNTIDKEGCYTIIVHDQNYDGTPTYYLRVWDEFPPVYAPMIPYDCPVYDAIDYVTDLDFLSFDCIQGSTVRLIVTGGVHVYVIVWNPSYEVKISERGTVGSWDLVCDETGKYLLRLNEYLNDDTLEYVVDLECLFEPCAPNPTEGPEGDPSCSDGTDNDCDGDIDVADIDCGCVPSPEICINGEDDDCDGLTDYDDPDCWICTEPAECDDSDECTSDNCVDHQCEYSAVNCDDSNECTDDSCDSLTGCVNSCNATGTGDPCCDNSACSTEPICLPCTEPAECDDSDECTSDNCVDHQCQYSAVNCDDANECTDDSCDPVSGCLNRCNATGTEDPCCDNPACQGDCGPAVCAGSAVASSLNASPAYGSSDLAKHLAYFLLPLAAVFGLGIWRRRR